MINTISAVIILGLILYAQWKKLQWRIGRRTVNTKSVAEPQLPVDAGKEKTELEVNPPVEKPGR